MTDDQSALIDGEDQEYDDLFGGQRLPSLFNKTHGVGTSLTGIITKPPTKRQSRFYKAGGKGALKFWAPPGSDKPVTDKAVNADGTKNRPAMDELFILQTEYQMNEAELADKDMDEDTGERGFFASGASKTAIQAAIREAGIKNRAGLVGYRLTMTRTGKTVKGDFEVWKWAAKLESTVPF